ncbi:MAG: transporter [Planctomycetaceae bacterium]|nr:transporter [Planctomycetaceae bacterium]
MSLNGGLQQLRMRSFTLQVVDSMPSLRWQHSTIALLLSILFMGCMAADKQLEYASDAELAYYKGVAQEIDYPLVEAELDDRVANSLAPRTAMSREKDEVWELSLQDAIHIALKNNSVVRSRFSNVLQSGDRSASIYDPAIQETGVLFGGRGIEAALADFDAQLNSTMAWGRNETVQNNQFFGGGLGTGGTLVRETAFFDSTLSKQFASGGQFIVQHQWQYGGTNVPNQLFNSAYTGFLRTGYRHPLLAGSGTEYTRIAGPVASRFGGITGVTQGVTIARINNDISIVDFEANIHNLLKDIEDLYWDLYLNYRIYDTAVTARNSALRTWREAKAKLDIGGIANFKSADEAQARDRYFETKAQAASALNQIYNIESELRRVLGLAVNDGKVIRPSDDPISAKFTLDWAASLAESLTRRVELRRQKWQIKSLELQLKAANSLTRPRLDFVSGYRVNGFGDRLLGSNDNDGFTQQGFHSAYETLAQGNHTGWDLGFEFTMPLGFRSAKAQVRNIELRLAKAREILSAQELEVSHQLAVAFQNVAVQYLTAKDNFNRRRAALRRVELNAAEVRAGTKTLDLLLRAQASLADAEVAYFRSLTGYNKAINELNYRMGMLLEHNNVDLAEGEWTDAAYHQAIRRAWARTHAFDSMKLKTAPEDFVGGGFFVGPSETEDVPMVEELPPNQLEEQEAKPVVPPAPAAAESDE